MNDALQKVLADVGSLSQSQIENVMKAAETISTYTFSPESRSVFSPENLEADIKLLVPTDTPLRNRLPRIKGFGEATAWKKLTSKLQVSAGMQGSGTNTSISFADAGAPNETTQTYSTVSEAYKLLGRKVEVGGLALAASRGGQGAGGADMYESRKRIKMYEVMLGEEELLLTGSATSNTQQFDGLRTQITTNSGTMTLVTASGIGSLCQTLFYEGASPTLLLANARNTRALADELQGSGSIQRIVVDNQGNGIGGVRLAKIVNPIDGTLIDVMSHRFTGGTGFLLTEKSPAGEAWIDVSELIPMSRIDVPSSNFSYISFVLEAMALRVIGEPFQYKFGPLAVS